MTLRRELTAFDVTRANKFAEKHHKNQIRHGSGLPYISHPVAVSYIVAAYKRSKYIFILLVAAILHDVLEDSPAADKERLFAEIVLEFGAEVAGLLLELANDDAKIEAMGKLEYHKKKLAGMSSWALVIKLADRLHNITDKPTRKMLRDTLELMAHLRKARKLSRTHLALIKDIEDAARTELARREATDPTPA